MIELQYDGNEITNICSKICLFNRFAKDSIIDSKGIEWCATGKYVNNDGCRYMVYKSSETGYESILPFILRDEMDDVNPVKIILNDDASIKYSRFLYYYESIPIQSIRDCSNEVWYPTTMMAVCTDGIHHIIYINKNGCMNILENIEKVEEKLWEEN